MAKKNNTFCRFSRLATDATAPDTHTKHCVQSEMGPAQMEKKASYVKKRAETVCRQTAASCLRVDQSVVLLNSTLLFDLRCERRRTLIVPLYAEVNVSFKRFQMILSQA